MTEQTFEEQFPSLIKPNKYDENTIQRGGDLCGDIECVFTEDIKKHCIDKQKVINILIEIEKMCLESDKYNTGLIEYIDLVKVILNASKQLGLDNGKEKE